PISANFRTASHPRQTLYIPPHLFPPFSHSPLFCGAPASRSPRTSPLARFTTPKTGTFLLARTTKETWPAQEDASTAVDLVTRQPTARRRVLLPATTAVLRVTFRATAPRRRRQNRATSAVRRVTSPGSAQKTRLRRREVTVADRGRNATAAARSGTSPGRALTLVRRATSRAATPRSAVSSNSSNARATPAVVLATCHAIVCRARNATTAPSLATSRGTARSPSAGHVTRAVPRATFRVTAQEL
ncbi:hypothetical protein CERSUDRAFT_152746, partial [Gelatoporia subvermispora B]